MAESDTPETGILIDTYTGKKTKVPMDFIRWGQEYAVDRYKHGSYVAYQNSPLALKQLAGHAAIVSSDKGPKNSGTRILQAKGENLKDFYSLWYGIDLHCLSEEYTKEQIAQGKIEKNRSRSSRWTWRKNKKKRIRPTKARGT